MSSIQAYCTRPSAVLKLTGEDHLDFLQSQGTADFRGPTGSCIYSLWLDHKGLIHSDAFVLRVSEEKVLLVSYECTAAEIMEKFERHIIADDVEVTDHTEEWQLLSIAPESAASFLDRRSYQHEDNRFHIEADGYLYSGRRLGKGSLDYLVPARTGVPLEVEKLSNDSAEHMRIEGGIPSIPRDITPGTMNPVEANILSAVSFTKGCYLGQEVVARVHRLKRVSSRLVKIAGKEDAPEMPLSLIVDGREVGALTTVSEKPATGYVGIGWLKSRLEDGEQQFGEHAFKVATLPES